MVIEMLLSVVDVSTCVKVIMILSSSVVAISCEVRVIVLSSVTETVYWFFL